MTCQGAASTIVFVVNVYVGDWQNSRVQNFSDEGEFLAKFEATNTGVGAIDRPSGVTVNSESDVYITDWSAHEVQVYGPSGAFVTSLLGHAQQPSTWTKTYVDANPDIAKTPRRANIDPEWLFKCPVAIDVDYQDRILVLESARSRIQIYNKEKDYEEDQLNL